MIVLDTHVLVWWAGEPKRLAGKARKAIEAAVEEGSAMAVSSISAWEIAMLVANGRLELTLDVHAWLAHVEALPFLSFISVDNRIALRAVELDLSHKDPADRIIVATALATGATLVTADEKLRSYRKVKTVWD